jgi:hypothetical protein
MATKSQCSHCHAIFTSLTAFDLHRIGNAERGKRRCLTPREMQTLGMMRNDKGWWTPPVATTVAPWYAASGE